MQKPGHPVLTHTGTHSPHRCPASPFCYICAVRDLDELVAFIDDDPGLDGLRDDVVPRLDDDPGHDLSHALRVSLWTMRLGGAAVGPRTAIAAALLHDVVNLPKDSPERGQASERSAAVAEALLPVYGFRPAEVTEIAQAIRDHSYSRGATPTSPLGKALQDADRLEALGALGVFRAVSCGARMGSRYFHDQDPWGNARELNDRAFTVDHFFEKLLLLEGTMQTDGGRREAGRRTAFMRAFLEELAEEIGAALPDAPTAVTD